MYKPFTAERCRKISEALRGNTNCLGHVLSAEVRAKISQANKGKPKSEAHKQALRVARQARGPVSAETREKLSQHKGQAASGWRGGRLRDTRGYVLVYAPEHHEADCHHYVREHRIVAEKMLGRQLSPVEVVHHVNGRIDDNRPSNLVVFQNQAAHLKHHKRSAL